jgi:Tol biopolymer transport system component
VALKVLPPELLRDESRKRRFIQEAKAAAALNHPHIAVVHEIDEAEGTTFIVMELIEGETLASLLARGRLPLLRSLEIAVEIVEALSQAHEKGFVHRDLKPANVMVAMDGHIKVIDFGLAKLIEPAGGEDSGSDTKVRGETRAGQILGTLSYMSPEQARGGSVDHRTDIFTVGVVLYEMLIGELPFRAPSMAEVPHAIINAAAPRLGAALEGAMVPELQRILDLCLAKDPAGRYETAKNLLSDLRGVKRALEGAVTKETSHASAGISRKAVAGFALLLALGAFLYFLMSPTQGDSRIRLVNPVQITSALGVEDFPAWSPDGRSLVFVAGPSGSLGGEGEDWDIWVTQTSRGQPLNRTTDYPGRDVSPAWSPDGSEVAFFSERDDGGIFLMSLLAGPPRKLTSGNVSFPCWSADGSRLAYLREDTSAWAAEIVTLATGESRGLPLPGRMSNRFDLAWSRDGRFFAYVDAQQQIAEVTQIWVLRVEDGEAIPLTNGRWNDRSPAWSAEGSLYFVSNRGGDMDLWQQAMEGDGSPASDPLAITSGMGMLRAAFSPDGKKLAYARGAQVRNLFRVPILSDRPATWEEARQLTFDQALVEYVDVSHDGKRLAINSDRAGNFDIWMLPIDGGEMQQLTTDPTPDWGPAWSPDDREIAFHAYRSGNRDIWAMPASGGAARQLTRSEAMDYVPHWSPDGHQIVFLSLESGHYDLWAIPAGGGVPTPLTDGPGWEGPADFSPDGAWLAFRMLEEDGSFLHRIPAAGGTPERLTQGPATHPRWSLDGKSIFFTGAGERSGNLWQVTLDSRVERPLTQLSGRRGSLFSHSLATDGKYLYFTWHEDLSDIWIMDVVPDRGD